MIFLRVFEVDILGNGEKIVVCLLIVDHHHHHHHLQFLLSLWRIGPEITFLQDALFAAANPASTQELRLPCTFRPTILTKF